MADLRLFVEIFGWRSGYQCYDLRKCENRGAEKCIYYFWHPIKIIQMKYYLNMVTSNLEKIEVLSSDGSVGETTTFKDYRMIDGIPMFHRQEFKNAEGKTHTYYWDKIEINSVVYDFVFKQKY